MIALHSTIYNETHLCGHVNLVDSIFTRSFKFKKHFLLIQQSPLYEPHSHHVAAFHGQYSWLLARICWVLGMNINTMGPLAVPVQFWKIPSEWFSVRCLWSSESSQAALWKSSNSEESSIIVRMFETLIRIQKTDR